MESTCGRPTPSHDAELTHLGPGTSGGELLRRYWQPVGLSAALGELPKAAGALREDLVLFRDARGRAGLLDAHCCHRGTSLYYGAIEPDGIHVLDHLATSDRGVILVRKMLKRGINVVRAGRDPPGIGRDPARDLVATTAGNLLPGRQEPTARNPLAGAVSFLGLPRKRHVRYPEGDDGERGHSKARGGHSRRQALRRLGARDTQEHLQAGRA